METKAYTQYKGIYYFTTASAAHVYAEKNGYPTDRIIQYTRSWAIQLRVSGPYVGHDSGMEILAAKWVEEDEYNRDLALRIGQVGSGMKLR